MSRQDWRTPPSVFSALSEIFGPFDCDLAADENNHLCENWRGTTRNGKPGSRNWCNPPFDDIMPFVRLAAVLLLGGSETLMLTHANPVSPWFRMASRHACLWIPDRRICFWHPDEDPNKGPDRDTVVWHFGGSPMTIGLLSLAPHQNDIRRLWQEHNGKLVLPKGALL